MMFIYMVALYIAALKTQSRFFDRNVFAYSSKHVGI